MRKPLFTFLLFCICFALPHLLSAQIQDTSLYSLKTIDGNEFVGTIVDQDVDKVIFRTNTVGEITIAKSKIDSIEPYEAVLSKRYIYLNKNQFSTRYFVGPTAYSLPKGTGYYQNAWILFNSVSVGVTDNIDVGAGMIPLFLFGDVDVTPVWLTTKVSIPLEKDKINLAAGGLYLNGIGNNSSWNGGGFLYGVGTYGSRDKNVSFGAGWGYGFDEGIASTPTFTLGAMHRFKTKWAFVTDNYFIGVGGDYVGMLSFGARFLGENLSIDFGGFRLVGDDIDQGGLFLPWLSISVPFGKRKG